MLVGVITIVLIYTRSYFERILSSSMIRVKRIDWLIDDRLAQLVERRTSVREVSGSRVPIVLKILEIHLFYNLTYLGHSITIINRVIYWVVPDNGLS